MISKELIKKVFEELNDKYSLIEELYEFFSENKIFDDDDKVIKLSEDASDIMFVYKAIIDYDKKNKIKIDEINKNIEYFYRENENLKKENEKIKNQLKNVLTINFN